EWKRSKNCTIVKPKPISATEVRTHDIIVRSRLKRVRIHEKWLSDVGRTSSPCGCMTSSIPFRNPLTNPVADDACAAEKAGQAVHVLRHAACGISQTRPSNPASR